MSCKVVCISHADGAGGEEVGRLVAERLGFDYIDDEIVASAAAKARIPPADVADEERRKSFVSRLLEAWSQGGGEVWALTGSGSLHAAEELSREDVRALIREAVEQTAARGKVVIVAHAASHLVEPGHDALRVLVIASPDTRAERLGGDDAWRTVKDADAARRDYLKRFYGIDEESPTQYDLVVNTDALSIEQAARLVSEAGSS